MGMSPMLPSYISVTNWPGVVALPDLRAQKAKLEHCQGQEASIGFMQHYSGHYRSYKLLGGKISVCIENDG